MQTLVVATTNPGKVREIQEMLGDLPLALLTLARWSSVEAPEENGDTFEENARLKALYYANVTGELTLAEDSGLEIDALDGRPGVHSARFGGADTTYPEKFAILYEALRQRGEIASAARFVCTLALARAGEVLFLARGTIEGRIAPEPKGDGGFGYDPIFFYPPFGCTLAEAPDRKREVSHRAQACRALRSFLQQPHGVLE